LVSATRVRPSSPTAQDDFARERLAGKKVVVTGATGFVGSHLVERLSAAGADVVAAGAGLGFRPPVRRLAKEGRVRFLNLKAFWQEESLKRLAPEFEGATHVVHLGYDMPRGRTELERAVDDGRRNVLGALNFIRRLPGSVSTVCFASSASVYGPGGPEPAHETDRPSPTTVYAIGKLAAEAYLGLHAQETGVSVPILRFATVYGLWETDPRAIPNFIRRALAGRPPVINGDGEDTRDYVHVRDVVQAVLRALTSGVDGARIYNVGTGAGLATRRVAELIIDMTGKEMQPQFSPEAKPSAGVICDISRARSELGYEPAVRFDDGLREEIDWFRSNPQFWRDL